MPCLSKHGKAWTQGLIHHVLTSKALRGDLVVRGTALPGYVPALISESDWLKLRAALQQNKDRTGGARTGEYPANLFPTRCFCAECGSRVGVVQSRLPLRYYTCRGKKFGVDCGAKHLIKTDLVEKAFFLDVMRATPADLMIEAPRDNQQKAALEARLAKADAELGKLLALSERHSLAQLDARISALQADRAAAEAELGKLTVAGVQTGLVPAALTALQKCWDWDENPRAGMFTRTGRSSPCLIYWKRKARPWLN